MKYISFNKKQLSVILSIISLIILIETILILILATTYNQNNYASYSEILVINYLSRIIFPIILGVYIFLTSHKRLVLINVVYFILLLKIIISLFVFDWVAILYLLLFVYLIISQKGGNGSV